MTLLRRSTALFAVTILFACGDDPVRSSATSDTDPGATKLSGHRHVAMLDDCDPADPAWNATGGCTLRGGSVTNAEFNSFVVSPLSAATVGHPAWTNDPTYLKTRPRQSYRVTNEGGRAHTFTPVAVYGGGRVPPLNFGMLPAPECLLAAGAPDPWLVPPGGALQVDGLAQGNHRFQCCFHPWMRTLIKVESD